MEIAIYIIVGGLFLAITMWQRVQTQEQWEQTAHDLGLQLESGLLSGPKITGRYQGVPVEVSTVTRGGKNNRQTYTVFDVGLPRNAPANLVVGKEGFLAGLGKFVGMQDIEIGDDIFDDQFVIKGSNPAEVERFLTQDRVADEIFSVYGDYPNHFEIKDGFMSFESLGRASGYEIELALESVSRCVAAMRGEPARDRDEEPNSTRSGPFGGIPEHVKQSSGATDPAQPPPAADDGRFGPPSGPPGGSAPSMPKTNGEAPSDNPDDNQHDDWW
jgi:hypothetical protein